MAHSRLVHRRPRFLVTIVVAVLALLAAGCHELPGSVGAPNGPPVIVIGDSMVVRSSGPITNLLVAGGYNVTVYAEDRLDTKQALDLILEASKRGPVKVVVITTANDAFSLFHQTRSFFDVRDTLAVAFALLDATSCQVWMDIDQHAPFYGLWSTGPTVNDLVDALVVTRPKARRVDWRDMLTVHPELDGGDGLHPNAAGSQRLAEDINGALSSCPH